MYYSTTMDHFLDFNFAVLTTHIKNKTNVPLIGTYVENHYLIIYSEKITKMHHRIS